MKNRLSLRIVWCLFAVAAILSVPVRAADEREIAYEYLVMVAPESISAALDALGYDPLASKTRMMKFLDTADLYLYRNRIRLRVRTDGDGNFDTQAKVMGIDPAQVPAAWWATKDFEVTTDFFSPGDATSCQMKKDVAADVARPCLAGEKPVRDLFDASQIAMIEEIGKVALPWEQVKSYGPVQEDSWKLEIGALKKVECKLWILPGTEVRVLELSYKIKDRAKVPAVATVFAQELAARKIVRAPVQGSKIAIVLGFYTGQRLE